MMTFTSQIQLIVAYKSLHVMVDFIRKWGSHGNDDGQFNWPTGIAVESDDDIVVADTLKKSKNLQVMVILLENGDQSVMVMVNLTSTGIAVDSNDDIYVVDSGNNRVQKFTVLVILLANGDHLVQVMVNYGQPGE